MFTGLVQAVGQIAAVTPTPQGLRLVIDPGSWTHRPAVGDSISVSGVCLTVAALETARRVHWTFDAIPETLAKTTLGHLKISDRVNLEHAVTAATLMGGHFVQGHVDGVGAVASVQSSADWRLTVTPPAEVMPFLAPKGSITIDGVSLTIAALAADSVTVALIPTTLALTTLGVLQPGDRVNIEADMLAKTVVNYLQHFSPAPSPHEKGWG